MREQSAENFKPVCSSFCRSVLMDANKSDALWMQGTRRNTRSSSNHDKEKNVAGNSDETKKDQKGADLKKVDGSAGHIVRGPHNEVTAFKTDDEISYKLFDSAYIATERHDNPYFIATIQEIKVSKKDNAVVVVKWYYRPGEVPDSVYQMLVKERLDGAEDQKEKELILNVDTRNRELFVADDDVTESFPVSRLRGKCSVKHFSNFHEVKDYDLKADAFFYILGYNPETRRLTSTKGEVRVGPSHQWTASTRGIFQKATIPDLLPRPPPPKEHVNQECEELVWSPKANDCDLLMYLCSARSMAAFAGMCDGGSMEEGCIIAWRDDITINALNVLFQNNGDTRTALQVLVKNPQPLTVERKWTEEQVKRFQKGLRQNGKNFFKIKKDLLPNKETSEIVEFYYLWKKVQENLMVQPQSKSRRQASMKRNDKQAQPSSETGGDGSSSEMESESDESDKEVNDIRCKHCSTTKSDDWSVGGKDEVMLCTKCRIFFKKYGEDTQVDIDFEHDTTSDVEDVGRETPMSKIMRSDTKPPPFLFKPIKERLSDNLQDSNDGDDSSGEAQDIKPAGKRLWQGDDVTSSLDEKNIDGKRIKTEAETGVDDERDAGAGSSATRDDASTAAHWPNKRHVIDEYPKSNEDVVKRESPASQQGQEHSAVVSNQRDPSQAFQYRGDRKFGLPRSSAEAQASNLQTGAFKVRPVPDVASSEGHKQHALPPGVKTVDHQALMRNSFPHSQGPPFFPYSAQSHAVTSSAMTSHPMEMASSQASKPHSPNESSRRVASPRSVNDPADPGKRMSSQLHHKLGTPHSSQSPIHPSYRKLTADHTASALKMEEHPAQQQAADNAGQMRKDPHHNRPAEVPSFPQATGNPQHHAAEMPSAIATVSRPGVPATDAPLPNAAARLPVAPSEQPPSDQPEVDDDQDAEPIPNILPEHHITIPAGKPLPDGFRLFDDGIPRRNMEQPVCYTYSKTKLLGFSRQLCCRTDLLWLPALDNKKSIKKEQKPNVASHSSNPSTPIPGATIAPVPDRGIAKIKPKEERQIPVKHEPARMAQPRPRSTSAHHAPHVAHQRVPPAHTSSLDNRPPRSPYDSQSADAMMRLRQYATIDSQRAAMASAGSAGQSLFPSPYHAMQSERDLRERELRERELRERMSKHGLDVKLLEGLDPGMAMQASWGNLPPGAVPGLTLDQMRQPLPVLGGIPGSSQMPGFHPLIPQALDLQLQQQAAERFASDRLHAERVAMEQQLRMELLQNHQHSHVHSHLHLHPSNAHHPSAGMVPPAMAAAVNDPALHPYAALALQAQTQQAMAAAAAGMDPMHAASMSNQMFGLNGLHLPPGAMMPHGLPLVHPNMPGRPESMQHILTATQHLRAVAAQEQQSIMESSLREEYIRYALGPKP